MYKIKNATSGSLSLPLEKGSVILLSGKTHDLDGVCSRYWIASNVTLQHLIKVGAIQVLEDSEQHIPKSTVKNVVNPQTGVHTDTVHRKLTVKEKAIAAVSANKRHLHKSPVKNVIDSNFEVFTGKIPKTPSAKDQFRKNILQKNVARIVEEDRRIHSSPVQSTPIHSVVSPCSVSPTEVKVPHISEKRGLKFVFKYDDEPIIIDLTKLEKERKVISQEEVIEIPAVASPAVTEELPAVTLSVEATSSTEDAILDGASTSTPAEEPVKKKRGRPKKVISEETTNE